LQRTSIAPRPLFTLAERRPEAYFYTSNLSKYLQANLIFQRAGLPLKQFVSHTRPYHESYEGTSRDLLEAAVSEVTSHIGHASLVFIEDTTVRIEALSTDGRDEPGLSTKEWFSSTSFRALDSILRRAGNRQCTVRSDIALHVPGLSKPILIHGETSGVVADSPPTFRPSPLHPWLTPETFNGWFIPQGGDEPLGAMELEASLAYDFRVKAFLELLDRIEELSAGLNLPPRAYVRQRRETLALPLPLFPRPIFVFVGPTCAGKTTAAIYLEETRGWPMVEASAIMRELGAELSLDRYPPEEMARRVVESRGNDVVARELVRRVRSDERTVISGLRFVEELVLLRDFFTDRVRLISIDAPAATRLARLLARRRTGDVPGIGLEELLQRDAAQERFGLIPFAARFADETIDNVGTKEDLYRRLDAVVKDGGNFVVPSIVARDYADNQTLRCLHVLARERRPMSTDEISSLTGQFGHSIRHNNVNKVLKRAIGLVRRIEEPDSRLKYEILPTGFAYIQLADDTHERNKNLASDS
jgi:dephospho-CoA kinase/inosine/xanthosine triphosphate pyrophosphatase family protein